MNTVEHAVYQLGRVDSLALQDTPIHRIDARAKVITTLVFVICVVSFPKYAVIPLLPFALFPAVMAGAGLLPFPWLGQRVLAVAPFAVVVGMFNPLIDREIVTLFGGPGIAAGWLSFASIIVRFLLTTAAALTLIGTTGMNGVCAALERLRVPDVFVTQLLLLYRYLFVLTDEALRAVRARDLRSFGRRGTELRVFGQLLGHLLLRTNARAQRVYAAMLMRGFDGHVRTRRTLTLNRRDVTFMVGWCAVFVVARAVNLPELLGGLIEGALS